LIFTCITGKNDVLLKAISDLYFHDGDNIADVTYGKGAFWKKTDLSIYNFKGTDLKTGIDFRKLPYSNASQDIVVLDPPYAHTPGKMMVDKTYNNEATTKGMYHKDIINLYKDGMTEAGRVLKIGGYLLVKCQDEIESSKQKWSHIELYQIALDLDFYAKDLFVLQQPHPPVVQIKTQQHARKNHSYMWVFEKRAVNTKQNYCCICGEEVMGKETLKCDVCGEVLCYYCYFKNEGICTTCKSK
jgi:hypothetical protein